MVVDFYVLIDFVILDMAKDAHTQTTLGRPFFATVGYKIDVKEARLTFDLGDHHAEFGLFTDRESSMTTLPYCGCDLVVYDKPEYLIDVTPNDPQESHYDLFEG